VALSKHQFPILGGELHGANASREVNETSDCLDCRDSGCSIGNSKSQLFKARLRLRKLLQEVLRSRARERRESSLHDGESFQSVCRVRRSQLKRQFGPLLAHAQKRDLGRPVVAKEVEHRDRFEAAYVTAPAPKNRAFGLRQQVRMSRASRSMRLPAHR